MYVLLSGAENSHQLKASLGNCIVGLNISQQAFPCTLRHFSLLLVVDLTVLVCLHGHSTLIALCASLFYKR